MPKTPIGMVHAWLHTLDSHADTHVSSIKTLLRQACVSTPRPLRFLSLSPSVCACSPNCPSATLTEHFSVSLIMPVTVCVSSAAPLKKSSLIRRLLDQSPPGAAHPTDRPQAITQIKWALLRTAQQNKVFRLPLNHSGQKVYLST